MTKKLKTNDKKYKESKMIGLIPIKIFKKNYLKLLKERENKDKDND